MATCKSFFVSWFSLPLSAQRLFKVFAQPPLIHLTTSPHILSRWQPSSYPPPAPPTSSSSHPITLEAMTHFCPTRFLYACPCSTASVFGTTDASIFLKHPRLWQTETAFPPSSTTPLALLPRYPCRLPSFTHLANISVSGAALLLLNYFSPYTPC